MRTFIRTLVSALFCFSMFAASANAQQISIDLGKLDSNLAAKVIEAQQNIEKAKAKVAVPTVSQAKEWADVGKNLAEAVGATAKTLSIEVNDFVKTPVGWWAFAFIFWYFLGAKIWSIFGGTIVWIVLGSIVWHSFSTFHIPKKKLVKEGPEKVKQYDYKTYEFKTPAGKVGSAWAHGLAFGVLSFVMLLIIF